jgi:hypothetical protein
MWLSKKIKFLNFIPTDGFRLYADSLVHRLLELSPSDADASSAIERVEARYHCSLEVVSRLGRFVAKTEACNPKSALEEARRRMLRQIVQWRRRRFMAPLLA